MSKAKKRSTRKSGSSRKRKAEGPESVTSLQKATGRDDPIMTDERATRDGSRVATREA